MKRKMIFTVFLVIFLFTGCSIDKTDINLNVPVSGVITMTPIPVTPTITVLPVTPTTEVTPAINPTVTITPITPSPIDKDSSKDNTDKTTTIIKPAKADDIRNKFIEAIPSFQKNLLFDLSALKGNDSEKQMTIMNEYYNAINQKPELKYAFNVVVDYDAKTKVATCNIQYMPYKTGEVDLNNIPKDTYKISKLSDLINISNNKVGVKNIPIAIVNPDLDVDAMQYALMQAGYGYIIYTLNNDATQIIASPTLGLSMTECVDYIDKINTMANTVLSEIITNGMSPEEKISAIYKYITSNVAYDMRYYNDRKNMPHQSTTAYGALKDNLAICGGFSWAFNVMLSKEGIECYNVSGIASGEDHLWNIAKYGDGFYYFDTTYDRGKTKDYNYFAQTAKVLADIRTWNTESVEGFFSFAD